MFNVKEQMMRVETKRAVFLEEVLRAYSGRRLQYAIKLGILPKPESFKQLIKRKANTKNGIKNGVMA
jgi:hypothetical protein